MADDNGSANTMIGVLIGALIVILVGGGILYATGVVGGPKATTVNVSVPKVAPAPAATPQHHANAPEHHDIDHHNGSFDHRDDHRSGGDHNHP